MLRVALVLDNTGSMNEYNKIGNLKTAAQNLVTQLSGLAKKNGDVYISLVPFEVDVNVGTSNVNASWLRWDLWDPKNYTDRTTHGIPIAAVAYWMTKAQCLGTATIGIARECIPSTSQWNGCVSDRDQSNDTNSTAPSSWRLISPPIRPIMPSSSDRALDIHGPR